MRGCALKVALVDDDESVRRSLARLLRIAGMEVDAYASGSEFLESITGHRPDCLVLDLYIPAMTGMEVQARLSTRHLQLPIVFITAHDRPSALELAAWGIAGTAFRHRGLRRAGYAMRNLSITDMPDSV
jgi:FixJ family two-component response regulator